MYSPHLKPELPLPPYEILERFYVHEPLDTRFRSCARLLQSIWRQRRGLSVGYRLSQSETELTSAIGSLLDMDAAAVGLNYLRPEIAKLVRREIAYRERGALCDEKRAWGNLLSSTALVFNLFGPMKLDHTLAACVLRQATGLDIKEVTGIFFETSPGRGSDAYIGDFTALDVLIAYVAGDGKHCFLGIEVKYSEGKPGNASPIKPRHREVAEHSGLFVDAHSHTLQQPPLRQFFAEHTLCHSMVENGLFDGGHFVLVAPSQNHEIKETASSYREHLADGGRLPFVEVHLERFVAAMCDEGDAALARMLDERYLDFGPIYDLIDDWEPHAVRSEASPAFDPLRTHKVGR